MCLVESVGFSGIWCCLWVSGEVSQCIYVICSQGCLGCFAMFCGVSEGSAHVESRQAGANPPFWPNPEMQDFFTEHL